MKFMRILFLVMMSLVLSMSLVCAKSPWEGRSEGSAVFVGEVACYGEHEIKPEFLEAFRESLQDKFNEAEGKGKLHVVDSGEWISQNGDAAELSTLKRIHMDAIAYGPLFQKDYAGAEMIRYAEGIFGEDYFWDESKLEARKARRKKPYRISQAMTDAAKEIGMKYGAEYLLFCNIMEVDAELATSIFNSTVQNQEERAKHIKVDTYYYLMDTKTGLVYEGQVLQEKTARLQDLFGTYGKPMTVDELLHSVFDVQVKKLAKDVWANGQKALEKGI